MTNTIYLLIFLLSLTLSSCGGGERSATDTGSASFGLKFEEASVPAMKLAPSAAPATDICSSYGIDTISGTVYNSSNTAIATGGPWACSAHQGTINNIPPGSNLRIAIKGTVSGTVVWQGETTGATIYAGQDTNVGSITMTYTGSDTTRPTVSAATPTGTNVPVTSPVTVTFSEYMAASTIDSTTFTLKNGSVTVPGSVTYNATTRTATFTPTSTLSNSAIYTATVTTDVTDMAANQMQSIYTWDFTTEAVSATAGNGQNTISWTSVTGAMSYNIYWSTATGVTTSTGTKITGGTSPYTHSGLTNGTTYYYIVTAVNIGGESTASSQVSATPVAPIPRKLPDTGQTGDYTTTFGEDSDYTINPPSYTDNGNGTITDNVTGLVWQKQDDGTTRTWADAGAYCNNLSLGGQTDWRLPSRIELVSIVDYGAYNPAINITYFPGTSSVYWSSATYANDTADAWYVYFYNGDTDYYGKTNTDYVRCVRGGQSPQSFTDNGNGTVTDNTTSLIWQKQDEGTTRTWENAISYCEGLSLGGHTDWRLPNVKELSSLVDDTRGNPAIDQLFPNTESSYYWSSTTSAYNTTLAWGVNFYYGSTGGPYKTYTTYVRCVRGQ